MIDLPKLPYPIDALSPFISGETLCFIHQKIMQDYVDTLPKPKKNSSFVGYLSKIEDGSIGYRSASELYHHGFWLYHLKPPQTRTAPSTALMERLLKDFGSIEKLHAEFLKHSKHPDVRWVWLVEQQQKLSVIATTTESILSLGCKPLAVCNLWEHAYYLDYRDRKADYIKSYLNELIHWERLESALYENDIWLWRT